MLVGHYGVHIALDDDGAALSHRLFGDVHCEQDAGFVKDRRSRGVEVFGHSVVVQGATAEPGDAGLPVPYRNHQAAPEKVVVASVVRLSRQFRLGNLFRRVAGAGQMGQQAIAPGRAVTELKGLQRALVDAPAAQVVADKLRIRRRQHILKEAAGGVVDFKKRPRAVSRVGPVDDGDADPGGQLMQGIPEIHAVGLHHEGEGVAALGARSEAAPGLAVGKNVKRGGAFLVKGAVGLEGAAGPLQVHVAANQLYDVQPAFYVVNLGHGSGRSSGVQTDSHPHYSTPGRTASPRPAAWSGLSHIKFQPGHSGLRRSPFCENAGHFRSFPLI